MKYCIFVYFNLLNKTFEKLYRLKSEWTYSTFTLVKFEFTTAIKLL